MAIFSCRTCGWSYSHLVSPAYKSSILLRYDHCLKCNQVTQFTFTAPTGMVSHYAWRPKGVPGPSLAAIYWDKQRNGKAASAPLDAICKSNEF